MGKYLNRDNLIIVGIFVIAVIGAMHNQWELATGAVTGGYALLRQKGDKI